MSIRRAIFSGPSKEMAEVNIVLLGSLGVGKSGAYVVSDGDVMNGDAN